MNSEKMSVFKTPEPDERDRVLYCGIAGMLFLLLLIFAERTGLWNDELSQIGFVLDDIRTTVNYSLTLKDGIPPLYGLCVFFWYRIAPFGEQWLLLPSIIAVVWTAGLLGIIGKESVNRRTGALMSILFGTSISFWVNIAYEFRGYSFLLLFSALSLLMHIRRNQDRKGAGWKMSVSLTALCFSHYFGIIVAGGLFLADLYLLSRKKITLKAFLVYILPAIAGGTWLLIVLFRAFQAGKSAFMSWQSVPTLRNLAGAFNAIGGGRKWLLILFPMPLIRYAAPRLKKSRQHQEFSWMRFYVMFSTILCVGNILTIFVYGRYVNQTNTMWAPHYFYGLVPYFLLVVSTEMDQILTKLEGNVHEKAYTALFAAIFSALLIWSGLNVESSVISEPFREAAIWLSSQEDITEDDTLVLSSEYGSCMNGWREYYFDHYLEQSDELDLYSSETSFAPLPEERQKEELAPYSKVYYSEIHRKDSKAREMLEREFTKTEEHSDTGITVYAR